MQVEIYDAVRYSADARERGVEAHGPRQREEELRKVRYKPEELGLYRDDPHATLKPELQREKAHWSKKKSPGMFWACA